LKKIFRIIVGKTRANLQLEIKKDGEMTDTGRPAQRPPDITLSCRPCTWLEEWSRGRDVPFWTVAPRISQVGYSPGSRRLPNCAFSTADLGHFAETGAFQWHCAGNSTHRPGKEEWSAKILLADKTSIEVQRANWLAPESSRIPLARGARTPDSRCPPLERRPPDRALAFEAGDGICQYGVGVDSGISSEVEESFGEAMNMSRSVPARRNP